MQKPIKLKLRQDSDEEAGIKGSSKTPKSALLRLSMLIPVVVMIGVGSAGAYIFQRAGSPEKTPSEPPQAPAVQGVNDGNVQHSEHTLTDSGLNFSFRFKDGLVQEDLSEQDKKAGFIARLTSDNPPMIVSVRKESGLRLPASMARIDTATLLKNNIDRSLPQRYPSFEMETSNTVTVNGKSVIERVFSYIGPSGERAKQRMLAILKDDDTAVYISMQTTEQDYAGADITYFEHIKTTITL